MAVQRKIKQRSTIDGREKYTKSRLLWSAKKRAAQKGLPFDEYIKHTIVWNKVCPVFGVVLDYSGVGQAKDNSPSIDRLVPSKGYVPGNVHVISLRANRIKNDADVSELLAICDYITCAA